MLSSLKDHRRHLEQAVQDACDAGQVGPSVVAGLEFDCQEDVGLDSGLLPLARVLKLHRNLTGIVDLVAGELEQELGRLPLVEECLLGVEFL